MNEGRKGSGNRGLVVLLSVLCFVICGLIAGIIVVINNNKLVLGSCEEAVNYIYENSDLNDMQTIIDAGDKALEAAVDDEVKACVYSKRFGVLYNYSVGNNDEFVEQLLSDALAAEGFYQDANTAYNVYLSEMMAGNVGEAEKWLQLSEDRGISNMPGKG